MKKTIIFISMISLILLSSCNDWLETDPNDIVPKEEVWNSENLIQRNLSNIYSRIPAEASLDVVTGHTIIDDGMWSSSGVHEENNNIFGTYPYNWFYNWDYTLIREINIAIRDIEGSTIHDKNIIKAYQSEYRFLRALLYFEIVKRMGGIPLVTDVYNYQGGEDVTLWQFPREKEQTIYDFIRTETEAIHEDLKVNNGLKNRANQYAALALQSRAMLYAASIAKYSATKTPEIANALSTGEVAMAGADKDEYYKASLAASEKIINDQVFSLMMGNRDANSYYKAINEKAANTEVIFARDHSSTYPTTFTYLNLARSQRETFNSGSTVVPTLNLVEAYDFLDGRSGEMKVTDASGNFIFFNSIDEPFLNRDARLDGTVLRPKSTFRTELDIQAGIYEWDGNKYVIKTSDILGSIHSDGKTLVGADGPHQSLVDVSNTGFYLRKFVDMTPGSGINVTGSEMWWVYFRMGEIYLNAAEAAFELNETDKALTYINLLRERAGFAPNSLSSITIEKIQSERRCELAFEDHRLWDMKRWRKAHTDWNGSASSKTANLFALYPYRVVGGPEDGKFVFEKKRAPRVTQARYFRVGSYYTALAYDVLQKNPKLKRNPLQN